MFTQTVPSIVVLAACTLFCANAQAGYIATDATVIRISSTNGNTASFQVMVAGGTGPCTSVNGTWVVFPLSAAPDADTHNRAYAAAMLALATGMRVTLYNYTNDDCVQASYVAVQS
jgi:hypothetical protein